MQRELLPVIIELQIGERHVADHGVDAILGQFGVAEILDADVRFGMKCFGNAAGNRIHLDADETHPLAGLAHEIAGAASWLQHRGISGNSQAGDASWMAAMTVGDV